MCGFEMIETRMWERPRISTPTRFRWCQNFSVLQPAGPAMLEGADALAPYAKKHFPEVAELPAWDGNKKNFQSICRESRSYRHQKEIIFRLKILNIQVKPVFMLDWQGHERWAGSDYCTWNTQCSFLHVQFSAWTSLLRFLTGDFR